MKKKLFKYLIITLSAISVLSFTACGKKPTNTNTSNTETSASVQEETDPYAVEFDIQAERESNASEGSAVSVDANKNASGGRAVQETEEETLPADEQEEIMAEELEQQVLEEESEAYEEYLNSDIEEEVELIFDREANGYMYFILEISDEQKEEFKVNKASVTGEIAPYKKGDEIIVHYNGAVGEDNELVKVYSMENQTEIDRKIMESWAAEDEDLAKAEGVDPDDLDEERHSHEHN